MGTRAFLTKVAVIASIAGLGATAGGASKARADLSACEANGYPDLIATCPNLGTDDAIRDGGATVFLGGIAIGAIALAMGGGARKKAADREVGGP